MRGTRIALPRRAGSRLLAVPKHRLQPARRPAVPRGPVQVRADLSAKGKSVLPKQLDVKRIMGEGSFGQVFEGSLSTPTGSQRVVVKRVKTRIEGAEEMSQMEHLLNVYASRVAKGHCADFLGYCEVAQEEATPRLTAGLWLVWKYEGSKTLSYYLRRRDTTRALAQDMDIPEQAVVPTVMKHIFDGLSAFHAAGLVHRDVKPLNLIFADGPQRFKLIDLGACADLRSGTNYVPEESILDLNYCPPEQFVLPTDSPHLARSMLKMAISPMLWAKHKPDRFDTWSAGIVLLQLAVPSLRNDRALRNFNSSYGPRYKYSLEAWRKGVNLGRHESTILDADNGAGWDLLQSLLAPRHIELDGAGGVSFVNDTPFQRISAYEALKHRFTRGAMEPGTASKMAAAAAAANSSGSSGRSAGGSSGRLAGQAVAAGKPGTGSKGGTGSSNGAPQPSIGTALGFWKDMTDRLFDLEAKIMRQASATELQTTTVKRLRDQVATGRADPVVLKKEEKVLGKMQARLGDLQEDFTQTANQASGLLGFLGWGKKAPGAASKPGSNGQKGVQQQQAAPSTSAAAGKGTADRSKVAAQQQPASNKALRLAEAAAASAEVAGAPTVPGAGVSPAAASAAFSSMWEAFSGQLRSLESKMGNQASATERQSLNVKVLRAKVAAGEADPELLSKAERTLSRMEQRLMALDTDYRDTKQKATGALAGKVQGEKPAQQPAVKAGANKEAAAAAPPAPAASSGGGFWATFLGGQKSGSGSSNSSSGPTATSASASAPSTPQKAASAPTTPAKPASTAAPVPAPAAAKQSSSSSGGGGFFGGFFGGNKSVPALPVPAPAAEAKPTPAAPTAKAAAPVPAAKPTALQPAATTPAASSSSKDTNEALVEGASALIRNSLTFTGMAARVAVDVASALKADAERYIEQQEALKQKQRAAELAFMNLLRDAKPALTFDSTYEKMEAQYKGAEAWQGLSDIKRRRQLFIGYVETLRKAEEKQRLAQDMAFKGVIRRHGITARSTWAEVAPTLPDVDAVRSIEDSARRERLFNDVLSELQLQEALKAADKKAEEDFTVLLEDLADPPVTSTSTWSLVRRSISDDARFKALPELRRRALFEAYTAKLFVVEARQAEESAIMAAAAEAEAAAATAAANVALAAAAAAMKPKPAEAAGQPATAAAAANGNGNGNGVPKAEVSKPAAAASAAPAAPEPVSMPLSRMEELRREQNRLRDEYEALANRLREMESRLTKDLDLAMPPSLDSLIAEASAIAASASQVETSIMAGAMPKAVAPLQDREAVAVTAASEPALHVEPPAEVATPLVVAEAATTPVMAETMAARQHQEEEHAAQLGAANNVVSVSFGTGGSGNGNGSGKGGSEGLHGGDDDGTSGSAAAASAAEQGPQAPPAPAPAVQYEVDRAGNITFRL